MSTREATFKILVGTNGTGKTTLMKKFLVLNERNLIIPSGRDDTAWHGYPELNWKAQWIEDPMRPGKQTNVVRIEDINTFTGTRVLHVDGNPRIFDAVTDGQFGFRNGGLFMDDFRQYVFSKGTLTNGVNSLFMSRRHKMVDVFMACHSGQDISADLIRFNPDIIVGYTTLPPNDTVLNKLPDGVAFLETVKRVNTINEQKPAGQRYYFEAVPRR